MLRRIGFDDLAADRAGRRTALLRLAIFGSFLSKSSGFLLQAIAIPLVYRSLGQKPYELYVLMTAILSTIAIAQMGAGPGLTRALALASSASDKMRERVLVHAAFRLSAVGVLVGGGVILAVVHFVPPRILFGAGFAADGPWITPVARFCVVILGAQVLSGVVDSALAGYQEQVFSFVGSMISNLLSLALLVIICSGNATIYSVIGTLYGVPLLSRLVNLIRLAKRRPYLMKGLWQPARGAYRLLIGVGFAFWCFQLGGLVEQHGGNYVLSHLTTIPQAVLFAMVYKSVTLAGAVTIMVTQPLWPALTDAFAHHDAAWIDRAYKRIRRVLTLYSLAVGAALALIGPWAFRTFAHVDTSGTQALFTVLAIYFVANVWTHLYYIVMMGLDGVWRAAMVVLAENLLLLLFATALVPRWGALGMAVAYLAASVVLPVWLLPLIMRRAVRSIASAELSPP